MLDLCGLRPYSLNRVEQLRMQSIRPYLGVMPTLGQRVFIDSSAVVIGPCHLRR